MQIIKRYNIAGIGIELRIPFTCYEETKYSFYKDNSQTDVVIAFAICDSPIEDKGDLIYSSDIRVFRKKSTLCVEHFLSFGEKPYAWLIWEESKPEEITCYVLAEEIENCRNMGHLFQLIRLERIFMLKDAMVLHSSFISWREKGILFTAPSGTGKSTQAELWKKHQKAEIINGDRVVLRRIEDCWQASGLPYAGSSNIFKNETRKISAIVVLRQGQRNEIQQLKPVEAFQRIYSEVINQSWECMYQEKMIELISDMVVRVPVYLLKCLPDVSAVDLLKTCLENDK